MGTANTIPVTSVNFMRESPSWAVEIERHFFEIRRPFVHHAQVPDALVGDQGLQHGERRLAVSRGVLARSVPSRRGV